MAIISKTDDLEILLAISDAGSFSGAANILNCQAAKISRTIQRLESDFGCDLFYRTTRRVEPTEEGKRFIEQVRESLQLLEIAEENLKYLKGIPKGRLRVDAANPFLLHQIVPLVEDFRQQYPEIELELISNDNIIDLIETRTDVAIRIGSLSDSNLHSKKLGRSKLRMVATLQYLEKRGMPTKIQDLKDHDIIGFSDHSALNDWPLSELIKLTPTICASSGEILLQLCLAHNGIALFSNFMIDKELKSGRLVEVLPNTILSPNDRELVHVVYYRNTALSNRIRAFIQFIEDRLEL